MLPRCQAAAAAEMRYLVNIKENSFLGSWFAGGEINLLASISSDAKTQ
jgi:hypothetical protein